MFRRKKNEKGWAHAPNNSFYGFVCDASLFVAESPVNWTLIWHVDTLYIVHCKLCINITSNRNIWLLSNSGMTSIMVATISRFTSGIHDYHFLWLSKCVAEQFCSINSSTSPAYRILMCDDQICSVIKMKITFRHHPPYFNFCLNRALLLFGGVTLTLSQLPVQTIFSSKLR